jgi:glycosyltransferase involved in cell wall biosynthesis
MFLNFFKRNPYKTLNASGFNPALPITFTYSCPNAARPSGGTKVIYKHVSIINQLQPGKVEAQVFHKKKPSFRCAWDFKNLKFKNDFKFDPCQEIYIVHEMWAPREAYSIKSAGIPYAIFVQNGYLINRKSDYLSTKFAYENAEFILCVSEHIVECVELAFPSLKHKIIRITVSVDSNLFKPAEIKENTITYMPRKLKRHAELVLFFLEAHLPNHWKIKAIDGLDQNEVAKQLGQSKIFLSFSELEGIGLPPIEAALAGNKVIGYTGEAGKCFWLTPVFEEVHCGDILGFVRTILHSIHVWDNQKIDNRKFEEIRKTLAKRYGYEKELSDLKTLVDKVYILLTRNKV